MAPLIDVRDPRHEQLYDHTVPLSRELVERVKSALDAGQSIITDARWREEQDELRALLVEELRHTRTVTTPVQLSIRDVDGAIQRVGQVHVLATPDAEPQGLAWDVRAKLIYTVRGEEFTDGAVSEWEA